MWTLIDGNRNETECDEHSKSEFVTTHGNKKTHELSLKIVVPRMGQTILKRNLRFLTLRFHVRRE